MIIFLLFNHSPFAYITSVDKSHSCIINSITMSEICVICQEKLCSSFSTIGTIVPCGHVVHRSCFQDFITAHSTSNTHITRVSRLPRCPICQHESKEFMQLFLSFDPAFDESPTNATETIAQSKDQYDKLLDLERIYSVKIVELGRVLGQQIDQSNERIELLRSERQQLISNSRDKSDKLLEWGRSYLVWVVLVSGIVLLLFYEKLRDLERIYSVKIVELGRVLGQQIDQSNERIELLRSVQQLISNSKDKSDQLLALVGSYLVWAVLLTGIVLLLFHENGHI